MALPATHIRFAAAIADRLNVADGRAYLSGTLYPDSRWLTGVDRKRTHDRRFLDPDFPSDDFTLGWQVHCLCDRIQGDIHAGLLDGLSELTSDDRWVLISAAKVVQDMNDAAQGDLDTHLPLLTHSRSPNDESGEDVAAYLDLVRRSYSRCATPRWRDYAGLWTGVGLDRRRISQIEHQVDRILADDGLVTQLYGAYERMVDRWVRDFNLPSA